MEKEHISNVVQRNLHECNLDNIDGNGKCFVKCIFEKAGIIDNDEFKEEKVQSILSQTISMDKLVPIMAKCNGIPSSTSCETAFEIYSCYCIQNAHL